MFFLPLSKMNTAFLILGGNQGEKFKNISIAKEAIKINIGNIQKESHLVLTKAWGNVHQPDFLNQVIEITTVLPAEKLLEELLKIEKSLGRVRTEQKWIERTMDIDILFYNNDVINTSNLIIPHPLLHERNFVLVPLQEIAKDYKHPIFNKSVTEMLNSCLDELEVIRVDSHF